MIKNITNTISTLLDGVEVITEKTVGIASKGLDVFDTEVDKILAASKATKQQEIDLAIAEAEFQLQKSQMKLTGKLSALAKLAEANNNTNDKEI